MPAIDSNPTPPPGQLEGRVPAAFLPRRPAWPLALALAGVAALLTGAVALLLLR